MLFRSPRAAAWIRVLGPDQGVRRDGEKVLEILGLERPHYHMFTREDGLQVELEELVHADVFPLKL